MVMCNKRIWLDVWTYGVNLDELKIEVMGDVFLLESRFSVDIVDKKIVYHFSWIKVCSFRRKITYVYTPSINFSDGVLEVALKHTEFPNFRIISCLKLPNFHQFPTLMINNFHNINSSIHPGFHSKSFNKIEHKTI